jgi:hypothetical protein
MPFQSELQWLEILTNKSNKINKILTSFDKEIREQTRQKGILKICQTSTSITYAVIVTEKEVISCGYQSECWWYAKYSIH